MMWTPHDIKVMIHHYASTGPWPLGDTSAYRDSVRRLHECGLIDRGEAFSHATEKGKALIDMWCAQPVPVAEYVDPRFKGE